MPRYQSRCLKALMDESEQALWTAAERNSGTESRIAKEILGDAKTHGLWEVRHAEFVRPVAEHNGRVPQVMALRDLEVRLVHRRALIEHVRERRLHGDERERLFRAFYGPRDFRDAVLAEHRQYMLAVSSRVSTDHLIDIMCDPASMQLVDMYETLYAQYFDLYCYVVSTRDEASADATKLLMTQARRQTERVRERLNRERPDNKGSNFERQAALARSGRYPVLNYMVG